MNKKGDIDWFIVTIILSVLTLVVFVLVIVVFPFTEVVDRTTCKSSIILRGALPSEAASVSVGLKNFVEIRCKSNNICVTLKKGKGNCTGLGKTFETKRLTAKTKEEAREQIRMFLAREMADCWDMFGEGKVQIFSREFQSSGFVAKGIICDRIEFDDSVLEGEWKLDTLNDFLLYMTTHKVPNNNYSYMDYLRGSPEGESARGLYGSLVTNEKEDADAIRSFTEKTDSLSLKGVKSIIYIESTLTNFGERIGNTLGASAGAIGSFYTKGFGWKFLVGGGAILGGMGGDSIQKWIYRDDLCKGSDGQKLAECGNHVGGLILSDYNQESLAKFNVDSFENL